MKSTWHRAWHIVRVQYGLAEWMEKINKCYSGWRSSIIRPKTFIIRHREKKIPVALDFLSVSFFLAAVDLPSLPLSLLCPLLSALTKSLGWKRESMILTYINETPVSRWAPSKASDRKGHKLQSRLRTVAQLAKLATGSLSPAPAPQVSSILILGPPPPPSSAPSQVCSAGQWLMLWICLLSVFCQLQLP